MHILPRSLLVAVIAVVFAFSGAVAPSLASAQTMSPQEVIAEDQNALLYGPPERAAQVLGDMRQSGVTVVRIVLPWKDMSQARSETFGGYDPKNPEQLGSFAITRRLDDVMLIANALGMRTLLSPNLQVPTWLGRPGAGTFRRFNIADIRVAAVENFLTGVLRRYNGTFVDGRGRTLPAVWGIEPFNEPNFPAFLQPQFDRRGTPRSPFVYARIVRAANRAAARARIQPLVLIGSVARGSNAQEALRPDGRMSVDRFFRELLCLDRSDRDSAYCRKLRTNPLKVSGIAVHPHPKRTQSWAAADAGDVTIRDMILARRLMQSAQRLRHVVPARPGDEPAEVWNTEYSYENNPPDRRSGLAENLVARYQQQAWAQSQRPWIRSTMQFIWVDPPGFDADRFTWHGGLRRSDGTTRPSYNAFRFPAAPAYGTTGRVSEWVTRYQPAPDATILLTCADGTTILRPDRSGVARFMPRGDGCVLTAISEGRVVAQKNLPRYPLTVARSRYR